VTVRPARRQLEHAIDLERLRYVEDDARHAGAGLPEPKALDQPDRSGSIVADGPLDFRQIDCQPRGLAQADVPIADRLTEIDHHAGGLAVLGETNGVDAGFLGSGLAQDQPGEAHGGKRKRNQQLPSTRPASCSGRRSLPASRSTAILALHSAAGWPAGT
jgi:hypothetical protein